jgi:hypothetical protein
MGPNTRNIAMPMDQRFLAPRSEPKAKPPKPEHFKLVANLHIENNKISWTELTVEYP